MKNDLINKQAKIIYNLQEKIRCLKFDSDENSKEIFVLKDKLKRRTKTITWIMEELEYAVNVEDIKLVKNTFMKLKRKYGSDEQE